MTMAFLAREIDAIVSAPAPESLMVQMLLLTSGVKWMNFPQSDAYFRHLDFLSATSLPRDVVAPAANISPDHVRLIHPRTAFIAHAQTGAHLGPFCAAGWYRAIANPAPVPSVPTPLAPVTSVRVSSVPVISVPVTLVCI